AIPTGRGGRRLTTGRPCWSSPAFPWASRRVDRQGVQSYGRLRDRVAPAGRGIVQEQEAPLACPLQQRGGGPDQCGDLHERRESPHDPVGPVVNARMQR